MLKKYGALKTDLELCFNCYFQACGVTCHLLVNCDLRRCGCEPCPGVCGTRSAVLAGWGRVMVIGSDTHIFDQCCESGVHFAKVL